MRGISSGLIAKFQALHVPWLSEHKGGHREDENHFTDQKLMENMKAAREFSDFVFDVWRAGWHELVHPFVDRLVDIDAFLRSKGRPVVTTESQFLRMLKPTLRTVIERNGQANARELVLRH